MHKAPGKSDRKGISLVELMDMFPNDETAKEWFESKIWPEGPHCPHCGSLNVQTGTAHKSMTHRCRDCPNKPRFSLKTGTILESTKLDYRTWALAVYMLITNLKGVSSMKLHRDLKITQKSAWHLMHRLRKAFDTSGLECFLGPIEVDETYIGGKRKNMPKAKRKALTGRGAVGKIAVVGIKDRATNRLMARVVAHTDAETLQGFVGDHAAPDAKVYTDDASAYQGLPFDHESVKHSAGEYVRGMAHINGIESFWSMLKRGYQGTFHHFSDKHTQRYVTEFAGRHNIREQDTVDQMATLARGLGGRRLRYSDLVSDCG
ncbi:MAG: IS1595 family transposase [Calditrichaeota bacterium]|nr:IS1595 family transposase [Calditrichota bacterium]